MRFTTLIAAAGVGLGASGCPHDSCLEGSDTGCVVVAPCPQVRFSCEAGQARVFVLGPNDPIPRGLDTLASPGDVVLENDQVVAVIDAIEHPHHLAPSGGMLLDLARRGGEDALNQAVVATGLLPEDTARYTELSVLEDADTHAVIVRGRLAGDDEHFIATRYEIRPCEPGIRARTEVVNRARDPAVWAVTDGWFWGGRDLAPFVPLPGTGFVHPDFGLTTVNEVWRDADFLAAAGPAQRSAAYAVVRCDGPQISGFHSTTLSAAGTPRRVVQPGDYEVYERFIAVADSAGPAPAIDVALALRAQLHRERSITIAGTVTPTTSDGPLPPLGVTLIDGDTPRSAAVVGRDGRFSMRVPGPRPYTLALEMFGKTVLTRAVDPGAEDHVELTIVRPSAAAVRLEVTLDGEPREAQVFFAPADAETEAAVAAKFLSSFGSCAPLLGPLHGASPACNRVLTRGATAVLVPPGRYRVRATAGLAASVAEATIAAVEGASVAVSLPLLSLPLWPAHVLSADFHVHGGASFDSGIPDATRVHALLAAGLDVIATTDHDVVTRYSAALDAQGGAARLHILTGIETTALVLHRYVPDDAIPRVIGHWNFFPMSYTPASPYRGGAWDELVEPGTLFVRMLDSGLSPDGVIQLNHPFSAPEFGRDLGFPRAIGFTVAGGVPTSDDSSAQALVSRVPPGGGLSNLAYHTQEVMNGTDNLQLLAFRGYWHALLSQGVVRAGTANSDSHGLSDNIVGTPRNLVFTRVPYQESTFLADVRAGRMVGTNGPLIVASIPDVEGSSRAPSIEAFRAAAGASLSIEVRAPPWVPVDEVRVVVDGVVKRTITTGLARAGSPFDTRVVEVWRGALPLSELLPGDGKDHWLSVEAGAPLPAVADLDCDGIPDTTDNDGNGVIDERDAEDFDPDSPGSGCDVEVGPARSPPVRWGRDDPRAVFEAVTPGGFPFAFTGPLLLDATGDGFAGSGR